MDIDALDLAAAAVAKFSIISDLELWVAFGSGKHFRYILLHKIECRRGPEKKEAQPLFHAYTRCDTESAFAGRGKRRPGMCGRGMVMFTAAEHVYVCDEDVVVLNGSHSWFMTAQAA